MPKDSIYRRGLMFVLSSPSGAGKTTISRKLLEQEKGITMSVSVTTRAQRPGEEHGKDYYFVGKPEFDAMVSKKELLEHAQVFGNFYGTPRSYVEKHLTSGEDVLFDIDWQGTRQLSKNSPSDLVSVFILPPSLAELERRLRSRAQDSEEIVESRMRKAVSEISHWDEYDYVLINRDIDESIEKVRGILKAERTRRIRQDGLADFVRKLRKENSKLSD